MTIPSTYCDPLRVTATRFDLQHGGASFFLCALSSSRLCVEFRLIQSPESSIQYQASILPSPVDPLEITCNSLPFSGQKLTLSPPNSTEITPNSTDSFIVLRSLCCLLWVSHCPVRVGHDFPPCSVKHRVQPPGCTAEKPHQNLPANNLLRLSSRHETCAG